MTVTTAPTSKKIECHAPNDCETTSNRQRIVPCPKRSGKVKASAMKRSCRRPSIQTKHYVEHNYHDHAHDPVEEGFSWIEANEDSSKKRRGHRGGVAIPFPEKLHYMLSRMEDEGTSHIVAWQPHGRCFIVHKPKEFVEKIMPKYFRQSKLTSFQRQLNLYGFSRLTTGADRGGYYHELFIQGRMDLCRRMLRTRVKGNGSKAASSPSTEPNFYAMCACRPRYGETSPSLACACNQVDVIREYKKIPETDPVDSSRDTEVPEVVTSDDETVTYPPKSEVFHKSIPTISPCPSYITLGNLTSSSSSQSIDTSIHQSMPSLPIVSPYGQRSTVSPPDPQQLLSSLAVPTGFSPVKEAHSGDQIFFEGLPFHYLETKDIV